ncbi:MAG: glycosyltransferase [Planctomycetota bacterium]
MIAEACDLLANVNVGVVGSWGAPRGRDRVGLRIFEQLLGAGAVVHAYSPYELGPGGAPAANGSWTDAVAIGADDRTEHFRSWLRAHPLQAVIFVELDDVSDPFVAVTRLEGVATLGALVWERVFPAQAESYRRLDAVLAPHSAFEAVLRSMAIPAIPFRWGWRPSLPKPPLTEDDQIELLHVAGERGGWARKGTEQVAEAFLRLADQSDLAFRITTVDPFPEELAERLRVAGVHVHEGCLPDARLQARLRGARVSVQPSLWEGIGLPILESLAEGTPVVTTDGPPMSEYIRNKAEGLLVPTRPEEHPELAVPLLQYEVDALVACIPPLTARDLLRHRERKALAGGATRVDPERACRDLASGIRDLVATGAGQP